jgi:hypothetical protein
MKLLLAGARVSPSWMTGGVAYGAAPVAAGRCSAAQPSLVEAPFAGLAPARATAAAPSTGDVTGHVSSERVLGDRPAGIAQRTRLQHIDFDPHRLRPSGGCG